MILIKSLNISEDDFLLLIDNTKSALLKNPPEKTAITPAKFEELVFDTMVKIAKGGKFEGNIRQTGAYEFPDIVANGFFGVEVKMTFGDKWSSIGNSILETSRIEAISKIYLLFAKFGGNFDIHYRLYQDCLPDIAVTHSPRYKINMNLKQGESIFDKMGVDYNAFRNDPEAINIIKKYYKKHLKQGDDLWWIDSGPELKGTSPIIQSFRHLKEKDKTNFKIEVMIFFPEIFGKSSLKFERVAAYLITHYNAVSSNIRDLFTAGGQQKIILNNVTLSVPKIVYFLYSNARLIKKRLREVEISTLSYYWECEGNKDPVNQYLKILDQHFSLLKGFSGTDIFKAGILWAKQEII